MSKKTMKWKDIIKNANDIKTSVEKTQKSNPVPGFSTAEILNIFSKSVLHPGKDITVPATSNYTDPKSSGIYKNLTSKEYLDVATTTSTWFNHKKTCPNFIKFGKEMISIRLAVFAFAKIIVFYAKNKQMPDTCWFAESVFGKKIVQSGNLCKKLSNLSGIIIKDYKSLYQAIMEIFSYDYYYEDGQTQSETISRRKGNCVDLNQVEFAALLELYKEEIIQIVRGTVQCSDGVYGHVWCRIKTNGKWVNIDASAAAKGKGIGSVICQSVVSITDINPSWAVCDTGDS